MRNTIQARYRLGNQGQNRGCARRNQDNFSESPTVQPTGDLNQPKTAAQDMPLLSETIGQRRGRRLGCTTEFPADTEARNPMQRRRGKGGNGGMGRGRSRVGNLQENNVNHTTDVNYAGNGLGRRLRDGSCQQQATAMPATPTMSRENEPTVSRDIEAPLQELPCK